MFQVRLKTASSWMSSCPKTSSTTRRRAKEHQCSYGYTAVDIRQAKSLAEPRTLTTRQASLLTARTMAVRAWSMLLSTTASVPLAGSLAQPSNRMAQRTPVSMTSASPSSGSRTTSKSSEATNHASPCSVSPQAVALLSTKLLLLEGRRAKRHSSKRSRSLPVSSRSSRTSSRSRRSRRILRS